MELPSCLEMRIKSGGKHTAGNDAFPVPYIYQPQGVGQDESAG